MRARALAVEGQARLSHQRAVDLRATKIASQEELDKAIEALQVAGADVKRAQASIGEAESQALTAEKNLLFQKERLSFTRIVSPYDGLSSARPRSRRGMVPGSSDADRLPDEIWVRPGWMKRRCPACRRTARARVFRSEPGGKSYPGEVARLGRETDRETREFLVDVRVKELPKNWTVGQRAEVFIETGRADASARPAIRRLAAGKAGVRR